MSVAASTERCVLCGGPEPFGLSVCSRCGGAAHAVGDTLIFVRPAPDRSDRELVDAALADLLQGRAHRGECDLVARGHRALIRLPGAAAAAAIQQLALRGIPAEARAGRRAWGSAPGVFYFLLAAILLVGGLAGAAAAPAMRWTSPMVAVLLLVAAQAALRRPLIASPNRRPTFSAEVEGRVAETFARLPDGAARGLLADLVRVAERVRRSLEEQPGPSTPDDIEQLVSLACRAAVDLADLDTSLEALRGVRGGDRAERLRDGLTERFYQAIAVLNRLRVAAIDADPARAALAELIRDLGGDADAAIEAQRELAQVLADS